MASSFSVYVCDVRVHVCVCVSSLIIDEYFFEFDSHGKKIGTVDFLVNQSISFAIKIIPSRSTKKRRTKPIKNLPHQ